MKSKKPHSCEMRVNSW